MQAGWIPVVTGHEETPPEGRVSWSGSGGLHLGRQDPPGGHGPDEGIPDSEQSNQDHVWSPVGGGGPVSRSP